eukprot:scaffold1690_cov182-Amphora_coffeaeformis.AAC.31
MVAKSDEADVAAGHSPEEKPMTKRQRRKMVNNTHKWPQMPKIQSPEKRAKAYIRVAGLSERKDVDFDLNDPSARFGRLLGSADQRVRHQAVLQLESYLKQKCDIREEDDEENMTGLSELDLLKLWKALWHTLYMADKVPVQQELSQKLAELIWCVAGTEEEDEYAAQVYLNMYGDDAVGFADEYDDEEDITMEEIENTLKQEVGSESEESEEEEEEEEEEEDDDDEKSESDRDDNDDDDSEEDETEEEEDIDDSEIPHCRGAHLASLFVRTFFHTVRREWGRMDKYRVDKFYSLIRMMMHQVFRYMGLRHWSRGIVRIFNDVLHEEILSQTPNGLRYHLIDLTLEELAAVNKKAPMPLTEATFLDCVEPYFAMASVDVGDDSVRARVIENVLSKFLEEYSFVSPNPAKDGEGKPLTMDQVHVGTVAELIFSLASDTDTPDHCRDTLYEMHKRYMRAIKKAGKDVDLGPGQGDVGSDDDQKAMCMDCNDDRQADELEEESDEEVDVKESKQKKNKNSKGDESFEKEHLYDGDVDTPERIRKRKLMADEESDLPKNPPQDGESSKKRKKRKKKKKDHEHEVDEEDDLATEKVEQSTKTNKAVVGKGATTDQKKETPRVHAEKVSEENKDGKKKKNKKKKSKGPSHEASSANDKAEKSEVITISMADQKAAKNAMKAPKKKVHPEKSKDNAKAIESGDSEAERKRVKFGEKNMARSWKASMKGLRTMSPATPLPTPEKGILYKKDGGESSGSKKAKKIKARRKAADYF